MDNRSLLKVKQGYDLEMKIFFTVKAIREFIDVYGVEGVYVPYSGGKDSTVLLDIMRKNFSNEIPGVFSNTKNEFHSIIEQVKYAKEKYKNVLQVMSSKSIEDVIKEYGYPVVSKKTSRMLHDVKTPTDKNDKSRKLYTSNFALDENGEFRKEKDKEGNFVFDKNGDHKYVKNSAWKIADKHMYLVDAPFKISEKCCDELKKKPMKEYEKKTGRKPIIATMATESKSREDSYIRHGCNQFDADKPKSVPMSFWNESDVLEYIVKYDIKIASVYGDIVKLEDGTYKTTGESRTGCVACILGMEFERKDKENRIQRLARIEPKKYDYVINKLGFKDVLEYMNYNYKPINEKDVLEYEKEKVKLGNEEVDQLKWII